MDTRLVSTFTTLARSGSFTAAATELHLAQSTVTAHIQALERELRVRLIDRLLSGAELTEAGRRTLERAERLLEAEAALRADAAVDGPIEGLVTVGAPETLCAYLLPGTIAELQASHPAVEVRLTPVGTADAVQRLRDGRLSIGLLLEPSLTMPDLVVRKTGSLDLEFVCAPAHAMAGGHATWPELARHPWFLLEEGCTYSDDVAHELRAVSEAKITRLGSVEAVRACVAAGLGLTLLPAFAVAGHELSHFHGPRLRRHSVLLAHHARRSATRAQLAVLGVLTKAAREDLNAFRKSLPRS